MRSTVIRTAFSQIKYQKARSILIGISIVLTTALLMMIGTCTYGIINYEKINVKALYGDYHGVYVRMDNEECELIQSNPEFTSTGMIQKVALIQTETVSGVMYALDQAAAGMMNMQIEGTMPLKSNEIAAPEIFFTSLGYQGEIGEKVSLYYRVQDEGEYIWQEFVISAIIPSTEAQELAIKFPCYTSNAYADEAIIKEKQYKNVYFKIADEENYNYGTIQEKIKEITAEMGISEKNLDMNNMYCLLILSSNMEAVITGIVIAVMVILFAALVIYHIFYVGMIGRIHELGKLRAIGATRGQLKAMIFLEGLLLSGIAVPIGVALGGWLSVIGFEALVFQIMESAVNVSISRVSLWNVEIVLLVVLCAVFTIWLSLRKPMKVAARVSPVEAMRYNDYSTHADKKQRRGYAEISLTRMTLANLFRNRKRTISTILTMGLSSVLFIVVANVGASCNAEDLTRRDMEKGDFLLELDYSYHDETYPENDLPILQGSGLLDDDLVEAVKSIPGVKLVEVRKGVVYRRNIGETEEYGNISFMNREEFDQRKDDLFLGEVDYDSLVAGGGMVFTWGDWLEEYELQIGDNVVLNLLTGQGEIPVSLQLQAATQSADTRFILPEEMLDQIGIEGNSNMEIFIYCEENRVEAVETALKELTAGDDHYLLTSYREQLKQSKMMLQITVIPAYALLVTLGIIGFLNMANTMITGIITRKQEIGMLQAIGLTNRQMQRMLQMEGIIFTAGTLILSLTVGNILGYGAFTWMRDQHMMGIRNYHFPQMETLIFVLALIILQGGLSAIMSRYMRKEAIIDRIRYSE